MLNSVTEINKTLACDLAEMRNDNGKWLTFLFDKCMACLVTYCAEILVLLNIFHWTGVYISNISL